MIRYAKKRGIITPFLLLSLAFVILVIPGCSKKEKSAQAETKGTIALSFPGLDVPMIGETFEVAKRLLNKAGYDVIGHDPQWDSNVQRNDWDTWISQGEVDLIAYLIITDPEQWEQVAKKAEANKIKLVSTNMTLVANVNNFMFEDDYTLGYETGEAMDSWMQERFKGESSKIMVST